MVFRALAATVDRTTPRTIEGPRVILFGPFIYQCLVQPPRMFVLMSWWAWHLSLIDSQFPRPSNESAQHQILRYLMAEYPLFGTDEDDRLVALNEQCGRVRALGMGA